MNSRLKFVISCVISCVVALALATSFVTAQNAQKGKGKGKGKQRQAQRREQPATQPSDRVYGIRVTEDEGYHTAPAAAEAGGAVHLVWIQYVEGVGDTVATRAHARSAGKTGATPVQTLSPKPGQYIRPVLAASGDELACFWTETYENNRACIWTSRFTGGKWARAERLLPKETNSHQNPEVAATAGGKFAVIYQVHNGKDYDLHLQ